MLGVSLSDFLTPHAERWKKFVTLLMLALKISLYGIFRHWVMGEISSLLPLSFSHLVTWLKIEEKREIAQPQAKKS